MPASYDHLKLIIQRYDTLITGSNTKAAFLLAFNTFVCGGILTGYKTLASLVTCKYIIPLNIFLLIILISGIFCLFFVMRAMYPYTKSGNCSTSKYHSLIFFKSVVEFNNAENYVEMLKKQTEDESWEDLAKQIYAIAKGLKQKYKFIEYATTIIYLQLSLIFFLVVTIICDNL